MPYYQVYHSYPLQAQQKAALAEAITRLHAQRFTTPSLFVNVRFVAEDASDGCYFMGGQARATATNRITAMVRTSEKRTKAAFDALAAEMEDAWHDVVTGPRRDADGARGKDKGTRNGTDTDTPAETQAKKLLFVVFHPMITARENGVVIPGAGQEGNWLKDNMDEFKDRAEKQGDQDFIDLLKEVDEREDLKKLLS